MTEIALRISRLSTTELRSKPQALLQSVSVDLLQIEDAPELQQLTAMSLAFAVVLAAIEAGRFQCGVRCGPKPLWRESANSGH
jgi:hypothetical protein